ncbi:MAG: hypothetical protein HY544_00495 [Candidatus Diapherotrites archaeon]|uniref:Uncharacterized protein n=1 Tax=Candidatus Iainarchaeum sp. TaxID=3101447 RepID=A0A8T3YM46_9ARCH|nr:hypothetical protein [Candidatus Diapherotrites archaeon]
MRFFTPPKINSNYAPLWRAAYFLELIVVSTTIFGFVIVLFAALISLALSAHDFGNVLFLTELFVTVALAAMGINLWIQTFLGIVKKEAVVNNGIGAISSGLPLVCGSPKEEPVRGRKAVAKGAHTFIALVILLFVARMVSFR